MVPAKETAEEQLLHMIEGPAGVKSASRRPPVWMAMPGWIMGGLWGGVETLRGWFVPSRKHQDRSDAFLGRLRIINRGFWVVLFGLGGYLVFDLVLSGPKLPAHIVQSASVDASLQETVVVGKTGGGPVGSLEEYQQMLKEHNPFRLATRRVTGEATTVEITESALDRAIKSLTVVGINRGAVPEALIEDTSAQRTYFVKVGEQVNGVVIEAIDQRGVMVSYDGETTYIP